MCLACLATLWDKILDLSSTAVQSRIEPPILLKRFTKKDIHDYCAHMLRDFHQKFDIKVSDETDIWPLGKSEIESAYAYSHGNPREAIKWLAGVTEEKKVPILKSLDKNNKSLIQLSKKIKKKVEKIDGYSTGILQRKNGLLISLSGKKKRFLITIPPLDDLESIFITTFIADLKEAVEKEEYNEIIVVGESKPFEKADLEVKNFLEDDLDGLEEYLLSLVN
ncbi:MAG: hypothetical protein ACTSQ9_00765, partial [Candidatus Hodarchaeales archaeon]